MKKYLAASLTLLISIAVCYAIARWKGLNSFLFAWILNFMLMMTVLAFTQSVSPALRSSFYLPAKWEKSGRIYELLGVNLYRKLLVLVGWEKINKAANPVSKRKNALIHLEVNTRRSEFGHWLIFFIVTGFAIYVAFAYGLVDSLPLIILNLLLNLYPVLVQRYNRPRLLKLIS
jgi:hypothetical protein